VSSIHDVLEPDDEDASAAPGPWQPQPWWAWSLVCVASSLALLLVAATRFADATFGTSLRARGCDSDLALALALLGAASLLLALGWKVAALSERSTQLGWSLRPIAWTLPVPALLLALTAPGVLGCAAARDLADLAVVGEALVGAPGLLLCGAATTLVGVALASAARVTSPLAAQELLDDSPGIVELAIAEAEALESDETARRFRGVDDPAID
jgi:hypothetical protein